VARALVPRDVRRLADSLRVAEDPACHLHNHGLSLLDVILALRHCFRVQPDPRTHRGRPPSDSAFRADCHYLRGTTMRVDFNLAQSATGDLVLVVTAFIWSEP
jgi:hypothetical protein